ncbi:arsenosugar biosynthesis radical SAM (seleno)protein ArsS [Flavobacterium sp. SUN052]|uniref:arsenosugar biosynthesis radical SAM (seleno)protein ArsS n=1 Tax=Flavobacterium sp. SUN052 TaxID=3002441 RepID=UPI00237DAF77|nr:arsenosugar biosynthesis radical SAM (seleno)protein ArsS [Flavobacterium sp. SUN052]MEC4004368.1 arsenosugar biosynthesis radical SAM (seleno)protein ArsS [Flavobacterium sp. SUN052]
MSEFKKIKLKSLKANSNSLSKAANQIVLLEQNPDEFTPFRTKLKNINLLPLVPTSLEIFQINLGKMCNQVCTHCHVDAGPDRKEIMTKETMEVILEILKLNPEFKIVDMTGGAPEMNPHFRWFVEEISKLKIQMYVRCNLTIINANKKYNDLPEFFKKHKIEVISSLPFYSKDRTDKQRGDGVFESSIKALKMLNEVGYGKEYSDLKLNLVYNPAGAFLPPDQNALEKEYKTALQKDFGIAFNNLFAITNLPVSRYLDYLVSSGNFEDYMTKLIDAFNPSAALNVMCRNTISIGWDGYIYDCDFNQMLELKVTASDSQHIKDFNATSLLNRNIIVNNHCYGCTAGAGSSCGGAVA